MKRSYIILSMGAALLIIGFGLTGYVTNTVEEKFQSTGIAIEGVLLKPGQEHSVSVSLYSEEQVYLLANSAPRNVPLIAMISDMNGNVIYEVAFDSQHVAPIPDVREGDYVISLANVGDDSIVVNALVSTEPIAEQLDIVLNIAVVMIAGILLIIAGIIVIIVGVILFFVDKSRIKPTKSK